MRVPWPRRGRSERDADLDDEIRAHFAMAVADRVARGESPDAAAAAARREFGNVGYVKELTRESWGGVWLDRLRQDVHYAFRALARSPGFAAAAILTFALGIGVNTAMFTVLNGVLLRPLPFKDPDRLYLVSHRPDNAMFAREASMLDRQYVEYRRQTRTFEATTSYNTFPTTLTGAGEPARIATTAVTAGFFDVLGVRPSLGRAFGPDESHAGAKVVIISDAVWRDRFSSDRAVIGRSLSLDGERRTIVGVMPPGFDFPTGARLWFPTDYEFNPHRMAMRPVLGRLAAGVTPRQARAELVAFVQSADAERPAERVERAVTEVIPLRQQIVGNVRRSLLLFAGAVSFVLLIACANVANLLLMRAATRQREISVRAAIGAGRQRLIRQLLTESVVLAFLGGLLGLVIAAGGVRALLALAPVDLLPRVSEIRLDGTVLGLTALLCVIAGVGFGIVPAFRATRPDLHLSLSGARHSAGAARVRLRNTLVAAECALAIVLLVGAGLLMRSFVRLRSVNLGFRPDNIVTFMVDLSDDRYPTVASMHEFRARTNQALARLPGVSAVAAVNWRPLSWNATIGDFELSDGRKLPPNYMALKPAVTPDYFRVMGIRIREGRAFTDRDEAAAPRVVVVSRLVADRFWPNGDAIGQRIAMVDKPKPEDWMTIVGIADDIVQFDVKDAPTPAVYLPLPQVESKSWLNHLSFAALTDGDPTRVERAIRQVLQTVDPLQPLESVTTMQAVVSQAVAEPLFQTRLLGVFAVLAVLLSAVGIYGVLAYAVAERTHEIGIRVALGARPEQVAAMVVQRTLALAVPGIVIGLAAASWVTRLLAKLLFEVSPTDPWTFGLVAVVLGGVAIAASVIPARRASRVDPMVALRAD